MFYKSVKENDGTYSIRESKAGANYQVIMLGVRGCNVSRTLNRLYTEEAKAYTVYVVAWDFEGGKDFTWYYDSADANTDFENEDVEAEQWTAYRFDYFTNTNPRTRPHKITAEIEAKLDKLCEATPCKKESVCQ